MYSTISISENGEWFAQIRLEDEYNFDSFRLNYEGLKEFVSFLALGSAANDLGSGALPVRELQVDCQQQILPYIGKTHPELLVCTSG